MKKKKKIRKEKSTGKRRSPEVIHHHHRHNGVAGTSDFSNCKARTIQGVVRVRGTTSGQVENRPRRG